MRRFQTMCIATVLSAAAVITAARASTPSDPAETVFWQSAERLGTAEAYRAYLTRFPDGMYAPLARAAIDKPATPPASASPLRSFTDDPRSGAVTFSLGERIVGPQPISVGWFGARKQLILPAGTWIALASHDRYVTRGATSASGTTRIKLATAVFGKFSGSQLASLLVFTFSAEKTPAVAWGLEASCEGAVGTPVRMRPTPPGSFRDEVLALGMVRGISLADADAGEELNASLARLGATVPQGPASATCVALAERRRGALRAVRLGWPAKDEAEVERWWDWAQQYQRRAVEGFENQLETVSMEDLDLVERRDVVAAAAVPREPALPGGQDALGALRVAKEQGCRSSGAPVLRGKGPGFENWRVTCDAGDAVAVRCEFGTCRVQ